MRLAAAATAAVALTAIAGAGLIGNDDSSEARPVAQRAAAALAPGRGGLRYFARVHRTQDPLRRSTIEAMIAPGGSRGRVVERDASGRVWSKSVTKRGRTLLYIRGARRPVRAPRGFAYAPSFLDGRGLDELRSALPGSSVSGPMEVDGRQVYKLSWVDRTPESVWRHDLVIDAHTFAPVRHVRTLLRTAPQIISPRPGARVVTQIVRFERLP